MKRILIIEDDLALAKGLCRALACGEIETESCSSIGEARVSLESREYDLVILDVNLPDGSGLDFLIEIKNKIDATLSVMMLTANDLEIDIVTGLDQGADDYITKPFSLAVLRARVNAQLRKVDRVSEHRFTYKDLVFDFDKMEFYASGSLVELSKTEQKLLRMLTEHVGVTLSRNELIDRVWTDGAEYVDENALSVAIKRLRDKLGVQDYIRTVYGMGYMWVKANE